MRIFLNFIRTHLLIILVLLGGFLILLSATTMLQVKAYNQKVSSLKNFHKTLLCPMRDAFNQVYGGYLNPFSGVDCGGDYPGKTVPVPTTLPLRRFQGGSEICDRFPNTPGCQ